MSNAISVTITGACAGLSRTDVADKTLIVQNGGACSGRGSDALLQLLSNAQPGVVRAIVGVDDPSGDALPRNYALFGQSDTPPFLRNRYASAPLVPGVPTSTTASGIFTVPPQWAQQLGAALDGAPAGSAPLTLLVATNYVPLPLPGYPTAASVALGHMQYFTYEHPSGRAEDLTITVTPEYGNPDLYVRTAAAAAQLTLPTPTGTQTAAAQYTQTSPGDDALSVPLTPARRAVAIGVFGHLASRFSILVSAPSTEVRLESGRPRRFEVAGAGGGGARYFAVEVRQSQTLSLTLTTLSATPPDVYASSYAPRPDASSAELTLRYEPNATSYQHALLRPEERRGCAGGGGDAAATLCVVHVTVAPSTATVYAVVATAGADPTRLIDGVPQAGRLDGLYGGTLHYVAYHASRRLLMAYPEVLVFTAEDLQDLHRLAESLRHPPLLLRLNDRPGSIMRDVRQVVN